MGVDQTYSKKKPLKGQVFIAGAVMMLVLIAAIVISLQYNDPEYDRSFGKKTGNLEKEFRFASFSDDGMKKFSEYLHNDLYGFRGFYAVFDYNSGLVKVTIGNYLGSKKTFIVESSQFNQTFVVVNNMTSTNVFSASGQIELNITVDEQEHIIIKEGKTIFTDFYIESRNIERKKAIYYSSG